MGKITAKAEITQNQAGVIVITIKSLIPAEAERMLLKANGDDSRVVFRLERRAMSSDLIIHIS